MERWWKINMERQEFLTEEERSPFIVLVNAGFGHRSYSCSVNSDNTMTIPDQLVRELDYHHGDDLDFNFDEDDGILYVAKKTRVWEAPQWLS
jgi:hypothetical protein